MIGLFLQRFFVLLLVVTLGACATGSMEEDIARYNESFSPTKSNRSFYIKFLKLPGTASASLSFMVPTGGLFIPLSGSGSVDCDQIAKQIAEVVFGNKFKKVIIGTPNSVEVENYIALEVDASCSTSSINGYHVAKIHGLFKDESGDLLFEANVEHTVDDWQYAQLDSMQRAFYGAFHKLLVAFENGYVVRVRNSKGELQAAP